MDPLLQLAQYGHGGSNYIRIIGFLVVVGFSLLNWIFRKLQEQSAKRKAQERLEQRELEQLRTGRPAEAGVVEARVVQPATPAPASAAPTPTKADVERRIEELRRRREAMAQRRAAELSQGAGPRPGVAPPTAAPAPIRSVPFERSAPAFGGLGTSGPIVPPRRPMPVPAGAPRSAQPERARRETNQEEPKRSVPMPPAAARGERRGTLANRLEQRDASQAASIAPTVAPPLPRPALASDSAPRTPAEWRRAIMAREILAPPVAMRDPQDSAPGLNL